MKRKLFSALLFGAFAMASTSTFTSCKDYDDDINSLNEKVANLDALKAAKADVESTIASLKTQLESAVNTETARAKAEEAALAAKIATAESALADINALLAKKVDQSTFDTEVAAIYAKIEAVQTGLAGDITNEATLRKAADEDLQQQLDALSKIEGTSELVQAVKALQAKTKDLDVAALKAELQQLSQKIDAFSAELNVLNVLVKSSLRSLVFIPDCYYFGVEATKMLFLQNDNYAVDATAYDKKEVKGYIDHTRYATTPFAKVLDFKANYHLNPSNVDATGIKAVKLLDNDLDFVMTRTSDAVLTVKNWSAKNGKLGVEIKAANPDKVKSVLGDQKVTNFATQVTIAQGVNDTTITSDYATVYKENVKDLVLVHRAGTDVPFTGVVNTHEPACPVTGHVDNGRLMQTAFEAHTDFGAQDWCYWDDELDLCKLVETHYTKADGTTHALLNNIEDFGLKYKFELTGLYYGQNATSESAHAAIGGADGCTFRPQMVAANGSQQAYGAQQDRSTTVGRTPLVRVSLVDAEDESIVYDYGYIRISIVDRPASPEEDKFISYTAAVVPVYNYECSPIAWSYNTTWNVTEYDLYHMLGITREEFEANYGAPVYRTGTSGELKQYVYNATTKKFTEATASQYYGTVTTITDVTASEDETKSSTLWWNITGAQVVDYFVTKGKTYVETAIKYESKNIYKYPDVWVRFNSGNAIVNKPSGAISWDPIKNPSYWYATNTSNNGKDEIHNNVLSPEDNANGKGDEMIQTFSAVMLNNNIDPTKIITVSGDKTANNEWAASKLDLDLVFSANNNGNVFKGNDGNSYWVKATDKDLLAHPVVAGKTYTQVTTGWEVIAKISSEANVNEQKIEYVRTSVYAQELLNYASHSDLADDVIKAIVTVKAVNQCPMPLALDGKTFDVRFLRPINVFNANKTIEDANTTALQVIKLHEMVKFTDWRDAWKPSTGLHGTYCTYYGITGIEVDGVADGDYLSQSANVTTNQSGKWEPLKNVNSKLDFVYNANGGHDAATLTYKNFSSTVQEFQVKVPVVVSYFWGKIRTEVTITVKRTYANAKPAK